MPGPTPKPTAIRALLPRSHKKINKLEPKPATTRPVSPGWLDETGKQAFDDLAELLSGLKVVTEADVTALALLCDAYSEYRHARQAVTDFGQTYTTVTASGDSMVRPRPEVAIAQSAWKRISDMLKQFGLTPAARAGVQVIDADDDNPFAEFLSP